jgi:flagellar basal-body rod protein FlgC
MFDSLDISSSALRAQRTRLDTITLNVASMNTPGFKRRFVEFMPGRPEDPNKPGVSVRVKQDPSYREIYDPERQEYVKYPNIDMAVEFVNAIEASRAYEANVTAMEVTKAMMNASLRILA